jgi:hypothetical protein
MGDACLSIIGQKVQDRYGRAGVHFRCDILKAQSFGGSWRFNQVPNRDVNDAVIYERWTSVIAGCWLYEVDANHLGITD